MTKKASVLVVGSHPAGLIQALDKMHVNLISCKTLVQAQEVVSSGEVQLVFCDENLPDGSFRDLVALARPMAHRPRVVVLSRVGEWAEYLEALALGAFEVIPCPIRAADVQSAVIHGMRGLKAPEYHTLRMSA